MHFKTIPLSLPGFLLVLLLGSCTQGTNQEALRFSRWAGVEESKNFDVLLGQYRTARPEAPTLVTEYLPLGPYFEKQSIARRTGDLPDVFMIRHTDLYQWATEASLRPLDSEEAAPVLANSRNLVGDQLRIRGGHWGVPVGVSIPLFVYDRSRFEEGRIPFPSQEEALSWEEFRDLLRQLRISMDTLHADDPLPHYPLVASWEVLAEDILTAYGSPLFLDPVTQTQTGWVQVRAIQALEMFASLFQEGLVPPIEWDTEESGLGTPDTALLTGQVAIMHAAPSSLPPVIEAGIRFGTMPTPRGVRSAAGGTVLLMVQSPWTRKPEAALDLALWMGGEGQRDYGVSGDFPAHDEFNTPETLTLTPYRTVIIPSYVYRTLGVEKQAMYLRTRINSNPLAEAWKQAVQDCARGRIDPATAVARITQALSGILGVNL